MEEAALSLCNENGSTSYAIVIFQLKGGRTLVWELTSDQWLVLNLLQLLFQEIVIIYIYIYIYTYE